MSRESVHREAWMAARAGLLALALALLPGVPLAAGPANFHTSPAACRCSPGPR